MTESVFADRSAKGVAYYPPVMLGPASLLRYATSPEAIATAIEVLGKLEPDDYSTYLGRFLETGRARFGASWAYADICTVVLAAAKLVRPKSYLEIGVRRGRSMAMLASLSTDAHLIGFDMWIENYAGMDNPGADLVRAEMKRVGHRGKLELVDGDSHKTVPEYLRQNPASTFDVINVDGDHAFEGALDDLRNVIPRLSLGGVLIFDDIVHPAHPWLREVWRRAMAEHPELIAHEFAEVGFGVAFAIRGAETAPAQSRRARLKAKAAQGIRALTTSMKR